MVILRRLLLLFMLCAPLSLRAETAARIVFATPEVVIINSVGVERVAVKGANVDAGESIDTRAGRVHLAFLDGASVSLQPGTRLRVDEFRYAAANKVTPGDGVMMTLVKGALRTVTGWLGKADRQQYRLGSSVATIGIRGTEYGARLDAEGLTVSVYDGAVEVCSDAGCEIIAKGKTLRVRDRKELPRILPDSGPSSDSPTVIPELELQIPFQDATSGRSTPPPPPGESGGSQRSPNGTVPR